jgi:hypothetical protein
VVEDTFDRLLKVMPDIAKAVNQFESSAVQEQAFEALVRALGLVEPTVAVPAAPAFDYVETATGDANGDAGEVDETETTTTTTRRRRRRSTPAAISAERDINFMPKDKQSFRDFAAEKKPENNHERNVVAVYYLEQVLNLPSITAGHVLAAYKECNWREPNDLANSLSVTATRKHWLDTSDRSAIRTTAPGRNQVEHYMPSKK